ncbi:MAG: hypothetical protein Kow00109_25240 [Acidobacteriota bacterium]
MSRSSVRCLVVLLVWSWFASGELQASEVSFGAGFASPEDLQEAGQSFDLKNPQLVFVRYEKDFFIILGVEQNLTLARRWFISSSGEGREGLYYLANGVINFPVGNIVPNLVVGIGLQHQFGSGFPDLGTSFLTDWGCGLKFRELGGPLGFRIDYRRLGVRGAADETVTTQEMTFGLLLTF